MKTQIISFAVAVLLMSVATATAHNAASSDTTDAATTAAHSDATTDASSAATTAVTAEASDAAPDSAQDADSRARALVSQMTLEEKIDYISGYRDGFHIRPIERLGIPEIRMADGPQGIRNKTKSTLYACGVAASASWNPEVAHMMGEALGEDARARGVHIVLGPGANIYRSPLCGRNFEYLGEDPYLASRMAVNYIKGIQSKGVMATIKHFALNNQEYSRHHTSSDADERTMNEIYFPAFKAAVQEAKVGAVMTSYNLVNNVHAAESQYLITRTLREAWGFEGMVMSDWTSTYSTLGSVKSGLDLEMPRAFLFKYEFIKPLIDTGVIRESEIDDKVFRILRSLISFGFFDRPQLDTTISEDNPFSREVAYRMACESATLLKNDGILPLKPAKKGKIVLLGPNADRIPCGGGSGRVDPLYSISLYAGMQQLGKKYPVQLLTPAAENALDYSSEENIKAIESASAVILSVGFDIKTEREDHDRTFTLPAGQDELIDFALQHNSNVIVVIYSGGGVDMSKWNDRVSAILMGWYPGQEGGLAIAKMLSGEISPSGRLPMSIEARPEDNPTFHSYYPDKAQTKRGHTNDKVTYSEGVFMGYRGYDRTGIAPLYPFGHGLTYTTFEYSNLRVEPSADANSLSADANPVLTVSFTLENTGKADAEEVAQLYIGAIDPSVPRPYKELKAFKKVLVNKGRQTEVTLRLTPADFAFYDVDSHAFKTEPGQYRILIGASATDIRLEQVITLE